MSDCTLKVARTRAGYLVRIEGRGTSRDSPALAAFVSQYLQAEQEASLVLDLCACDYLDSTFLGCLLRLHREYEEKSGAQLLVLADRETREKLLSLTRLDTVLQFVDSTPETLGGFVTIPSAELGVRELGRHVMESHRSLATLPCANAGLFEEIADRLARELEDQPRVPDPPSSIREPA
jgi:anti-anti-sigma factor